MVNYYDRFERRYLKYVPAKGKGAQHKRPGRQARVRRQQSALVRLGTTLDQIRSASHDTNDRMFEVYKQDSLRIELEMHNLKENMRLGR